MEHDWNNGEDFLVEPGLTNEQIIRIEALNAAIKSLPFGEPFGGIQARVIDAQEHVIYNRADRFAAYITDGNKEFNNA